MKIFLDENFPRKAIRMLESHGFEVFDIRGTEIEKLTFVKTPMMVENRDSQS